MNDKNRPTRKVTSGALAGAAAIILIWGVSLAGTEVPGAVGAAITTVLTFGTSYMVRDA